MATEQITTPLPDIIAGPILREVTDQRVTLWLITSHDSPIFAEINDEQGQLIDILVDHTPVKVGEFAFINIVTLQCQSTLHHGARYYYDLYFNEHKDTGLGQHLEQFLYENQSKPSFVFKNEVSHLLHGSCRKPHHKSDDGLLAVDTQLAQAFNNPQQQPDLLMMSGDQVYIDDVSGPMLHAIHQVMNKLQLFDTTLPQQEVNGLKSSEYLNKHQHLFYQRENLLPDTEANETLIEQFISGKRKPIFTSVNANNHLITFAEVIAMYILVWSPEMWNCVDLEKTDLPEEFRSLYDDELVIIKEFVSGLGRVRRALAHIPVYMIFDDHDVTDDWNLTRGWEEAVYSNEFAKRIVGNALIGYWLCQGWGNNLTKMAPLAEKLLPHFKDAGLQQHDVLIDTLFQWENWHYTIDTHPKIVVLDTRTRRWRSESNANKPSGLMDWEALCELQDELIDQPSVIMVSPSPIFGVKLIEAVQRIFTFFGQPLMVDAENWMAHKGAASVILNIFRHVKTPPNFVILSGDVHYSFVYDVSLRFRRNTPSITQITSSGLKNEFPNTLLRCFDYLNRILYHTYSPLNWLTKRRTMSIKHRQPQGHAFATLANTSGIGKVYITQNCESVEATLVQANGMETEFYKNRE